MSLIGKLMGFGLRQVIGDVAGNATEAVANLVMKRFADSSRTLPKALARANDRSWQAMGVALAGDGLLDQIKVFFLASGDDKGIREQVRLFLKQNEHRLNDSSPQFRAKCLAEFKKAKEAGLLSADTVSPQEMSEQTARFQHYGDPTGMIDGAEHVIVQIADELAPEYPNLAKLLRRSPPGSPPLLPSLFAHFFRREVETNPELAHGLAFDGLRQLSVSQEKGFSEVGKALDSIGDQFEELFEQLDRIETVVVETHGAVLDLQVELANVEAMNLTNSQEVRRLLGEVLNRVSQLGMQKGEVKPHHSFSVRSEDERIAIKHLLARFRQMPTDQQHRLPALLNGLGKLQIGSGDYGNARKSFVEVSESVVDAKAQAEAHFNAYRASLEEKKWSEALVEIQKATALDSDRFSPFPMKRYRPKRILGAGGFGTAFLCDDRNFDEEVVVKTLHAGDLERRTVDVFREARLLRKLSHPSIIGVHECEYADPVKQARPFIVMDYFSGGSLEQFLQERGVFLPGDMIAIAHQIAAGLHAAHHQNILHRDIKPDNILIRKHNSTWKVKIIDFGLALRRQTIETSKDFGAAGNTVLGESVAGTIKYAPPEQMGELKSIAPGTYSDVYSFGKMCCYALFKTTEPRSRQLATLPVEMAAMLEQCIEQSLEYRLPNFEPVLKVLECFGQVPTERRREEESRQEANISRIRREKAEASKSEAFKFTDEQIKYAVSRFAKRMKYTPEDVLASPGKLWRAKLEYAGHLARTARQQPELEQPKNDGESKLINLVREAMNRTNGKPTKDDSQAANELLKNHRIHLDRAKQIVDDVKKQWVNDCNPKKAGTFASDHPHHAPIVASDDAVDGPLRGPIAEEKSEVANAGRWTEAKFLERVRATMPDRLADHIAFLDKLKSERMVDFCGKGKKFASYHVVLPGTKTNIAWVFDDGKVYVRWSTLKGYLDQYRDMWGERVITHNQDGTRRRDGSELDGGLFAKGNVDVMFRIFNKIKTIAGSSS